MSVFRHGTGFRFQMPDIGEVLVDSRGSILEMHLRPGVPPELLEDALTGPGLPLLWTLRGGYALHGAVVATPWGAIWFFGPSGAGKSTLAASFESEPGCTVLDDDTALLDGRGQQIVAHPSARGVSLWEDSLSAVGAAFPAQRALPAYGTKYRARRDERQIDNALENPSPGEPGGVRLVAAFHLLHATSDEPDHPVFAPMSPSDKFLRLTRSASRPDLTDKDFLRRQFDFLSQIVALVPICRLHFPRSFMRLPEVRRSVLEQVRSISSL